MDVEAEADKILGHALMHLMETAGKDGIITDEERDVVQSIEFSMRFYKQMLVDALADGEITPAENKMLENMKERIIKEGYKVAELINGVSKDEMNLLISVMLSLKLPRVTRMKE